jgi:hypothetical protein
VYRTVYAMPNEYGQSDAYVDVLKVDETYIHMHAERTGLSAPGYPDRAVYRLYDIDTPLDGLYVHEDGRFIPVDQWYAETGRR